MKQNKSNLERMIEEMKKTYPEMKERKDIFLSRLYMERSKPWKEECMKFIFPLELLHLFPRFGKERITVPKGGSPAHLQGRIGAGGYPANYVTGYFKSQVFGIITNPPGYLLTEKFVPEHVSDNKCDYTKENVYLLVHQAMNSIFQTHTKKSAERTSPAGGVTWDKKYQKWQVKISVYGKTRSFGLYNNEEEAKYMALKIYDIVKKHEKYRIVVHLYNSKGEFEPYVKVHDNASDVIKLMRNNISYANSLQPGWKYTTDDEIKTYIDGRFETIEEKREIELAKQIFFMG